MPECRAPDTGAVTVRTPDKQDGAGTNAPAPEPRPTTVPAPDTAQVLPDLPADRGQAMPPLASAPGLGSAPTILPGPAFSPNALPQILATLIRDGAQGVTEVALDPVELGPMQLSISGEGDGLRIAITAERPDTLDLLRRHADQLLADLRQGGLAGATVSFGMGGGGRDTPPAPPPQPVTPAATPPPAFATEPTPGAHLTAGTAALNLRL